MCGAIIAGLALGAPSAHADETVRFDAAGEAAHISLIGDSTLAGVRWYADYGQLQQFNFVLNAESCRRTLEASCFSREGFRSATVVDTIRSLDGELGDVLVVMSGYNDPARSIDDAIATVVDDARRFGVDHIVWLTLRAGPDVAYSDPQEQSSVDTFRTYNEQLVNVAASSDGFLQIADWATYSTGASGWFETDGVHLTSRGVDALTTFLAGTVQRVLAGEDVSPAAAPWPVLVPGAEGDTVSDVQTALIAAGIDVPGGADGVYGNDTMAAVAAYQRRDGSLQVTGAVDAATARALGVYDDAPAEVEPPTVPTEPPTPTAPAAADQPAAVEPVAARSGEWFGQTLVLLGLAAVGVIVAAVVARRRYVLRKRRERRWARVHPATSPLSSVADLRRSRAGEAERLPDPVGSGPRGRAS